jgi:hypothetical protein
MRALFPPAVATALHLPLHTPDHTVKLSSDEEKQVTAAAAAHDVMSDVMCTLGCVQKEEGDGWLKLQEPAIRPGASTLSKIIFLISACKARSCCCELGFARRRKAPPHLPHTQQATLPTAGTGFNIPGHFSSNLALTSRFSKN